MFFFALLFWLESSMFPPFPLNQLYVALLVKKKHIKKTLTIVFYWQVLEFCEIAMFYLLVIALQVLFINIFI